MTIPAFWSDGWTDGWIASLVNHLWQSTVVAALAWLLALMVGKNSARVRYWVWMTASVKFLLPFSVLTAAGEWLRSLIAAPIVVNSALANITEEIAQPFPQTQFLDATRSPNPAHHFAWLPMALLTVWFCGALVVAGRFARGWRRVYAARWAAKPMTLAADVPVLCSPSPTEPGIFGIFRPVLLLPEGILERLTPEQLRAIVAHEMCHVRRRDNLTFAVHMIVETVFWFCPPVWWIGARLIEERERACDEAVLAAGSDAEVYAEGILNVCKLYVESPLECVSGVSGSDLKKRIARVMTEHVVRGLDIRRKILLCAAGLALVALPVIFGILHAEQIRAQSQTLGAAPDIPKFDVISIKPSKTAVGGMGLARSSADGISIINTTAKSLIANSYGVMPDLIFGGPGWVGSSEYDINAKVLPADNAAPVNLNRSQMNKMTQALLADRFKLEVHTEIRELPVYDLTVAKGGSKLTEARLGDTYPNGIKGPDGRSHAGMRRMMDGIFTGQGIPISGLVDTLSLVLHRPVIDETGLAGTYDITLRLPQEEFSGAPMAPPAGADASSNAPIAESSGPSIFTVIEEQLGLKLKSAKGPVETIVIDHIEQPSPN